MQHDIAQWCESGVVPRVLDVLERERLVVDAAWRVIARSGVQALSVRVVAAEAGLPPSSLRYTFPSQQVVREQAVRAFGERLLARVSMLPGDGCGVGWARAALLELLPLDEARSLEMRVYLALGAAAMSDVTLRPLHLASVVAVRDVCARALAAVGVTDELEVRLVHALVDGLALHLVQDPDLDAEGAVAVVDRQLARY
jgi:DNA-binding transcriptional regulator YbjK